MRTEELAIMRTDELAIERYTRQPLPTLRDIVAVLFRQRWPMLAAFALVVIAVAVSGVWVPKYEAQMKILALRQRSDDDGDPIGQCARPVQQRPGQRGRSQLRS